MLLSWVSLKFAVTHRCHRRGNDLHHLLAELHVLPDFDRAIADDAGHRSGNSRVLQIELSLVKLGLFLLRVGLCR